MQVTRDVASIPGPVRFPGEGHGNPLQNSCLENPINRGVWWLWPIASQRVEHNGRKEARAHTRTPTQWTWVWASPGSWWWTGKPGVLQSMGPQSRTWLSNWTEPNWTHTHTGHFNISPKTLFLNVDFIPRFVTSCLVYGSPFLAIVHWTI